MIDKITTRMHIFIRVRDTKAANVDYKHITVLCIPRLRYGNIINERYSSIVSGIVRLMLENPSNDPLVDRVTG